MRSHNRAVRSLLVATTAAIICLAAPAASFAGPLAGWWPMNEGQGQKVYDWSGNGNHGMLGSSWDVDEHDPVWTDGRFGAGRALFFHGNEFVTIPRSAALEPKRLTVSTWIRSNSTPGAFKYIVSKGGNACDASSYGLYTANTGGVAFYVFDGTNFHVSPIASPAVWDNAWHNVAGTYDGKKVRLYVDGRQVGSGTAVPTGTQVAYPLANGNGGFGDYPNNECGLTLNGDIDTVRIWNEALPIDLYWAIARSLFQRQ